MSKTKRAPKELPGYLISATEKSPGSLRETFHYTRTQREAQTWINDFAKPARFDLFRISYDHYGEMKPKRKAGRK